MKGEEKTFLKQLVTGSTVSPRCARTGMMIEKKRVEKNTSGNNTVTENVVGGRSEVGSMALAVEERVETCTCAI